MILAGRVIDGRYVVEAEIGAGGMGVVLRARHQFTGAFHAVKMLRPDYALDAETRQRFLAEARAPNAIGHRGIVQITDANTTPEGELYLVMELLDGLPLRAALQHRTFSPDQIRRIVAELCDALAAAHARGFVHRDLKPENVFLCAPNDAVKILDFGIAKVLQAGVSTARTAAGVMMGTLA
jgi:serine/threonine protein kinase